MLLVGRLSKRIFKLVFNLEMNFMCNEKNDNKERVEVEWRMSSRDKKSLFSKCEVWGEVVIFKWKCLIGS